MTARPPSPDAFLAELDVARTAGAARAAGLGGLALAVLSLCPLACLRTTKVDPPDATPLGFTLPPPRAVPSGAPAERFFMEMQRADPLMARTAGGFAQRVRLTFVLTWSGAAKAHRTLAPALVDDKGEVRVTTADPLYPAELDFAPGEAQTFVAVFEAPDAGLAGLHLRPFVGEPAIPLAGTTPPPRPPYAAPRGTRAISGPGFDWAVPEEWVQEPAMGKIAASAHTRAAERGLTSSLVLTREGAPGDANAYAEVVRKNLEADGETVTLRDRLTIEGVSFVELRAERARDAGAPWKSVHWVTTKGGAGWVVTCLGPTPAFDKLLPLCVISLRSLRL